MCGERNTLGHLERLCVHYIQRAFCFITEVITASVGRDGRPVIDLDALDDRDYSVRGRVNDMYIVPRAIGLYDANGAGGQWQCEQNCQVPFLSYRGESH